MNGIWAAISISQLICHIHLDGLISIQILNYYTECIDKLHKTNTIWRAIETILLYFLQVKCVPHYSDMSVKSPLYSVVICRHYNTVYFTVQCFCIMPYQKLNPGYHVRTVKQVGRTVHIRSIGLKQRQRKACTLASCSTPRSHTVPCF